MSDLQISIEDDLYKATSEIAAEAGSDLPTVVRLFLEQLVATGTLSFSTSDGAFESPQNQAYLKAAYDQYKSGMPLVIHDLIRE